MQHDRRTASEQGCELLSLFRYIVQAFPYYCAGAADEGVIHRVGCRIPDAMLEYSARGERASSSTIIFGRYPNTSGLGREPGMLH
jgi:hypothetical protein